SVAVVLSAVDMWLIPGRVAKNEEDELRERAHVLALVLADPIGVAMDLEQPTETLSETLRTGLNDRLVSWVALYGASGKRIGAQADRSAPELEQDIEQVAPSELLIGKADVRVKSHRDSLGSVAIALRAERIDARRAASQRSMAAQAGIIVGIGLILAIFIS